MPDPVLRIRDRTITVGGTLVMGVVNANPDSFSDAGRFATFDRQLAHAEHLADSGADIVDIGGQSAITGRPEERDVDEAERVVPLVHALRASRPDVLISVDSYKPVVVEQALAAGAGIVNDVSGLRDPRVAQLCADAGAALVIMHTLRPPKVDLQDPDAYDDVVADVARFFERTLARAQQLGVPREALIVDPGPDFTKTPYQTVDLLRRLDEFRRFGRPLLLALSRKDFLGAITGKAPRARDAATIAAVAHVAAAGGSIVRVHDVAAAVDAVATVETLTGRRDIAVDHRLPDDIRHEPPATD
ncbi:dihydropteroate synthase [uncultured Jatrophihabitans sp.]|uniref:dihydropteroate synthase n=1 Tax=uncultured Jatrophihabitans sp. TaxID=1610747 RepID=UPI0035CBEAAA